MTKTILAIDPSLTNTAVILGGDEGHYEIRTFRTRPSGFDVLSRIMRYNDQVREVRDFIAGHDIESVFIEGYSFGSKGSAVTALCEYGGLLRAMLIYHANKIYEVAPGTLKKFATGSGSAEKSQVVAHLTKRYDVLFASDDEYDAFGIYRLGLVAEGWVEPANQQQREAADTVLGRATPKKRKKKAS